MDIRLEKSILATIAYFDVFDYPLTLVELQRLLLARASALVSIADIQKTLDEGELLAKSVRRKNGFLYVRGRDLTLALRHDRFLIAQEKYSQSSFVLHWLAYMPFVRALFLCNSLALANTTAKSDVDIVVIAKAGGVWWARMFCVALLSVLNRRPGQASARPKICLSFFVDEEHLDVRNLRMSERDIDFAYWVANFYPLSDAGNFYERFWSANYSWLSQIFPNIWPIVPHPARVFRARLTVRPALEIVLAPFVWIARMIQEKKFPHEIRDAINKDTRVRVEEGVLKFHTRDNRLAHMEAFVKKYESLLGV